MVERNREGRHHVGFLPRLKTRVSASNLYDVSDAEREVLAEVAQHIGRDIPKLDFREAAYRAALQRPETVLRELGRMGYDVGGTDE